MHKICVNFGSDFCKLTKSTDSYVSTNILSPLAMWSIVKLARSIHRGISFIHCGYGVRFIPTHDFKTTISYCTLLSTD